MICSGVRKEVGGGACKGEGTGSKVEGKIEAPEPPLN